MAITKILVAYVEEGDTIAITETDHRVVEDIRENSAMDGCWLEYGHGWSSFHNYNESVNIVVAEPAKINYRESGEDLKAAWWLYCKDPSVTTPPSLVNFAAGYNARKAG